jgi:hypothetical protein
MGRLEGFLACPVDRALGPQARRLSLGAMICKSLADVQSCNWPGDEMKSRQPVDEDVNAPCADVGRVSA